MNKSVEIPLNHLTQALNAMYWTFSPYLDYIAAGDPDFVLENYPWIFELTRSYNELVQCIPFEQRYEHKIIEF